MLTRLSLSKIAIGEFGMVQKIQYIKIIKAFFASLCITKKLIIGIKRKKL